MKASFVLGAALAVAALGGWPALHCCLRPRSHSRRSAQAVGKPLKDGAGRHRQEAVGHGAPRRSRQAQAVQPRSAFEDYKINELLWYVYLQQGRNADAAKLLEQQMASGQMPAGERTQRTKTLAQLYFRANNYGKAIQVANDYLKAVPGDRDMQMMVAQGYFQQKNYKGAIAAARSSPAAGSRARTCCSSYCAATTSLATRQAPPRRSSSCSSTTRRRTPGRACSRPISTRRRATTRSSRFTGSRRMSGRSRRAAIISTWRRP